MKSDPKRLSWFDLFKWAFNDTINKTYTTEEKSRFYDQIAIDFFHRHQLANYITNRILYHFPNQQPYICERAAGSGIVTAALYKKGLTKIRASDLSNFQLKILEEKLAGIETAIENFNDLIPEVGDDSVDVVFQVGATRFMTKQGQKNYIHEAARILKEGGILIWPVLWVEIPMNWVKKGKRPKTLSLSISRMLEKAGFEIIEAPWVFHGKLLFLTSTVIIAKKRKQPIQHSVINTLGQLRKKRKWIYLRD